MKNFIVLNGQIRFNGDCDNTRPYCGTVCCRRTVVLLSEEEQKSGKYEYQDPTPNCMCSSCRIMRATGLRALQRTESGCIYLDGSGKCSIYDDRPQKCRDFNCVKAWWGLDLTNKRGEM